LTVYGNDVGMSGERDAANTSRADRGIERRLEPVGRGDARARDAVLEEVILDEGDDLEIALVARRIEGDEARQKFDRRVAGSRHAVSLIRRK